MVTWMHDDEGTEYEPEPEGKRWVGTIVAVVVLAMIGSASAFAWRAGSAFPAFALGSPAASKPNFVELDEFHAFQQQVVGQMQSSAQALVAQQAEVKRLSDQVAAVSAKMDALQSSIASARAAVPASVPIRPKKPAKPQTVPRISTGGAPLPPPVQLTH